MLFELNHVAARYSISLAGNPLVDSLMIILAEYGAYIIPPLLVFLWLKGGDDRYLSFFVFWTVVLSIGFSYLLGSLYFYDRPYMFYETLLERVPQNTFPSQHAATMFPLAFAFLWKKRKLGYLLLAIASLNAFARIYVGFHFPLDIFVGMMLFFPAVLVTLKFEYFIRKFADLTTFIEKELIQFIGVEKYYNWFKDVLNRVEI